MREPGGSRALYEYFQRVKVEGARHIPEAIKTDLEILSIDLGQAEQELVPEGEPFMLRAKKPLSEGMKRRLIDEFGELDEPFEDGDVTVGVAFRRGNHGGPPQTCTFCERSTKGGCVALQHGRLITRALKFHLGCAYVVLRIKSE